MIHNLIFQAICRTGIFMICAQAVVHFRPNEAYEKYLKLLMSAMVLILLSAPIGSFLLKGGGTRTAELLERFEKELSAGMQEAEKNAREADRLLEQMTLEEVRRRVGEAADAISRAEAAGTIGNTERTGNTEKTGEVRAEGQAGILVELDGIEPIKIGQEE